MIETDRIYHMDCLEGMSLMADGSVDAIIRDSREIGLKL